MASSDQWSDAMMSYKQATNSRKYNNQQPGEYQRVHPSVAARIPEWDHDITYDPRSENSAIDRPKFGPKMTATDAKSKLWKTLFDN
jgi:hypothetical protein